MTIVRVAACMVIALAGLAAIDARPSAAEIYRPWCVDYPYDGMSCVFASYEQCMLTARGAGGVCVQNPWYLRYGDGQKGSETTGQGAQSRRR